MGAGKSTVGYVLANRLRLNFFDLDREIERQTKQSIAEIFETAGEQAFRDLESETIANLSSRRGIVVATGGGVIVREQNQRCMRNGIVIYLYASVEQQYARVAKSQHRPLIRNSEDPKAVLAELMGERDPIYRREADLIVMSGDRSTDKVVNNIQKYLLDL